MPGRRNIENQNESLKASIDKMSDKNSEGPNMNLANVTQKQASNNNSYYSYRDQSQNPIENEESMKNINDNSDANLDENVLQHEIHLSKIKLPNVHTRSASVTPIEKKYSMNTMYGRKDKIAE